MRFCPSAALTLSKSPKSLRYNFLAPVCRTCLFTSSQVDTVLDLREIESASPFEFITQTFAVFRVEVACEARSNAVRDAKRMAQGRERSEEGVRMAVREANGAEMRRQCAGCVVHGGGRVGWAKGVRMATREACGAGTRRQCAGREVRGAGACERGKECVHGRARSMRCRDARVMRGSRCARLGQCGRIASGAGVPHGARAWGAAMGHVARRGGALRAAGC